MTLRQLCLARILGLCSVAWAGTPIEFPHVGESIRRPAGDVSLTGSLLLPDGDGPFPAVVGLVGSGAYSYRGAWIEGHWPF